MALTSVTLVLGEADGTGTLLSQGVAVLTPSVPLTGVPDGLNVELAPVTVQLTAGTPAQVSLLATDNADLAPSGWAWDVSFTWVPGNPEPRTVFLPAGPVSFIATHASPSVLSWTPTEYLTELPNGTGVQVPAFGGFSAGTTYYVVNASGFTLSLAASPGGSPLASSGTGSGSLTVTQYNLSALTPVEPVTEFAGYLALPSGTPAAGWMPIASGAGDATAWGLPSFNIDGGSAETGVLPAGVINGGSA